MNKILTALIVFMMSASCGLIKHQILNRKENEASGSMKVRDKTSKVLKHSEIISLLDTVNKLYYLEIKPLGEFSFSVQKGFTGSAEYVKFIQKEAASIRTISAKQTDESVLQEADVKLESQKNSVSLKKQVAMGKINGVWLVLIGLGATFCWWRWLRN